MKNLSLKVLKDYLLNNCQDKIEENWINNNIGNEEVSTTELLDVFSKWWNEVVEEWGGDSEELVSLLVNGYKLTDEECNIVMKKYWGDNKFSYEYSNYRW
jgi:hypothetical protein